MLWFTQSHCNLSILLLAQVGCKKFMDFFDTRFTKIVTT